MEAEDALLIDMPVARLQPTWCDYRDICCIIISALISVGIIAIVIAVFVVGFKPYTIKYR